jgi:hypothetical protein
MQPYGERPGVISRAATGVFPAVVIAALLLSPMLFAGFYGDDFVLWHYGLRLIEDPSTLLIGPSNFYRPANAWLFASNHLLFGTDPLGYHVVTLLMHLVAGALLGLLVSRFVASRWPVFAAATVWMCSPYVLEPVQYVNVAYNDLTVLLAWLGLAVIWPGPGRAWSPGRVAGAIGLALFSVFCKESWVILPGLVVAFELFVARAGWKRVIRSGILAAIPAVAYTLAYPWIFPGRESYYEFGTWVAAKPPHLWACFTMLTPLEPYRPSFGIAEFAGAVLMLACAFIGWKGRSRLVGLGFAFFICALPPILFIPFQPTRYTMVPLVGFVLVMAGVACELVRWSPARHMRLAVVGVAAVVALVFVAGVALLVGDFRDMERLRAEYDVLLEEIEAFAGQIPTGLPVVCLRLEDVDPLHRLHDEGSLGVAKLYYQRAHTPYGLADWAQLFTYARVGHGDEILVNLTPDQAPEGPYAVVAHLPGRFVRMEPRAASALAEMEAWALAGRHVHLVGPWQDDAGR